MADWIQVKAGFYRHPKTLRLKRLIGSDAFWVPPRLWCYCTEHESDDISDLSAEDLKDVIEYGGDASALIDALKAAGFVTPDGKTVTGWAKRYGAKLQFYRERAKQGAAARWGSGTDPLNGSEDKTDTTRDKTKKHREASLKNASSMLQAYNPAAAAGADATSQTTKKPRARDPLLDALATIGGVDISQVTRSAWGAAAKALAEIKDVSTDVSVEEIQRRGRIYRQNMPNAQLTPVALAKWWANSAVAAPQRNDAMHPTATPRPSIYVELPGWRDKALARWPGIEPPATWGELSSTARNDLINNK